MNNATPKTTDQKIRVLRKGGSVTISECGGVRVIAERSGDGKTLRMIRESSAGFVVFMTQRF